MKSVMSIFLVASVTAIACFGCGAGDGASETELGDVADDSTYGSDESWDDLTARGPQHDLLDPLIGEWETTVKIWSDPQTPPFVARGRVERIWILDGRFVEEWIEELDDSGAVTWEAAGLLGYDRLTGRYEYTLVHTSSTATERKVGRLDPAKNVLSLSGKFTQIDTGIVVLDRLEIAINGPDTHTMTEYTRGEDGREIKEMEIQYTRRK
jgi:hypothetical protein